MNYQILKRSLIVIVFSIALVACSNKKGKTVLNEKQLFSLLIEKQTNINFFNKVEYTEEYNTYTYRNFYNGAGIGLGDFNNDGLLDIYFCGNIVDNKLYINRGNFVFQDITESAGVGCPEVWSTGVSIVDINGDGWQDIYVCKSGNPKSPNRKNELFINNGDLTFTEKATEYGLDVMGLSTHASFFDYDKDGDLDCYLLNNSFQSVSDFDMKPDQRTVRDTLGSNKLYRNDNGYFTDVSKEAGIYGSKIGFGLGVSVGDVNRDGWLDIYVSNDFFERDYLYINNTDGTFNEVLEEQMREISLGAMGADMADINNDTYPEIFTTEMTAEGNARLKTKVLFENWGRYRQKVGKGYYHQFARNVLQLNNCNNTFSEIGRLSGVSYTDWSWGALIMDLDNDGWKDIFVANGIYKDLLDRDYLDLYSNPDIMRSMIKNEENAILKLIDEIPSVRIPNYAFKNNGDLTFTNLASEWGLGIPSHSNGAAYGDLDNDGDLDLIVNNVNMPSFVFQNRTDQKPESNFLSVKLKGVDKNTDAIGANVTIFYNNKIGYQELIPTRGFKSCVGTQLHFGLGAAKLIDSLVVNWPDGERTILYDVPANQFLNLIEKKVNSHSVNLLKKHPSTIFKKADKIEGLDFTHRENNFVDFNRDRLLFQMLSNEGPKITVGDINGDGLDDLYICGAKGSPGEMFVQNTQTHFKKINTKLFETDKTSEDTNCAFFDADGDGDLDLYVTSGGNEFPVSSSALTDRLYINDGNSIFIKSAQMLPVAKYESTSTVQPADFDNDGDIDLFVGTRLHPFLYGIPVNGYLLENDGTGKFINVSATRAPELKNIGMITDMVWADIDNDSDLDMVIVGDWMPLKLLINEKGHFTDKSEQFGLSNTAGWWNTIVAKDLNADGNIDFVLGNHGMNSRFKASEKKPITMYVNDFDLNGKVEQIICAYNGKTSYPVVLKDDLVKQIPKLKLRYKKYSDYKEETIDSIFSENVLKRSIKLKAQILESCILINNGTGKLHLKPLPIEAQFAPVYAIIANDFDKDGMCDIVIGGNQYRAKPETGIYASSYGLFLKGRLNATFDPVSPLKSGISIIGEVRDFKILNTNSNRIFVIGRNNDKLQFYTF